MEMHVNLRLFVSDSFERCRDAERMWSGLACENAIELTVIDVNSTEGRVAAERLGISMVPALAFGDRVLSVGVPTPDAGRRLLYAVGVIDVPEVAAAAAGRPPTKNETF